MSRYTRKISKEDYDRCVEEGHVPNDIEEKYIETYFYISYGVYKTGFYEKDNEYYMWFDAGDSCD